MFPFESEGLCGYKDDKGTVVIEPIYLNAGVFCEGLAVVTGQNGKYGFIDMSGREVIPCVYFEAYDFNSGAALVSLAAHIDEDRWTYIDKQGNRLTEKEFALARNFSEDYAVVLKEGFGFPVPPRADIPKKWSFIDKSGHFATELDFQDARGFQNGYAWVKNNGKWGVADKAFNLVVAYQYDEIRALDNGSFSAKKGDVWVNTDFSGREIP